MRRKKNLYINIILLVPWIHSTVLGENFYPWLAGISLKTLSSLTKNATQVASKILRSLLHIHGPNTHVFVIFSFIAYQGMSHLQVRPSNTYSSIFSARCEMEIFSYKLEKKVTATSLKAERILGLE